MGKGVGTITFLNHSLLLPFQKEVESESLTTSFKFRNIYCVLTAMNCGGKFGRIVLDSTWDPQAIDNRWRVVNIDLFQIIKPTAKKI